MSVKDVLAAILAETERRRKIWDQMQQVAREAVNAVQEQAIKRGVEGREWVADSWSDACHVHHNRSINISVMPNGDISAPLAALANLEYSGLPNVRDSAHQQFEQEVVKALMSNLTRYCDMRL